MSLSHFFCCRASKMVDVISTRVKKVYANWESRTDVRRHEDSEPRLSLDGNKNCFTVTIMN